MDRNELFYQMGRMRDAFISIARVPDHISEVQIFVDALDKANLALVQEVTNELTLDALCALPVGECAGCGKC